MPARPWLGYLPAFRLLDLMALAASRAGVAAACPAALVVRHGMLEVGLRGVPRAGRKGAFLVTDLDQVTEGGVGLIGMRLVPVIAFDCGDRFQSHGELSAVGHGKFPRAVAAGRTGIGSTGECPVSMGDGARHFRQVVRGNGQVHLGGQRGRGAGRPVGGVGLGLVPAGWAGTAVSDRDATGVGHRDAQRAVPAIGRGRGQRPAEVRVKRAEAMPLPWSVGQTEQRAQGKHQVG